MDEQTSTPGDHDDASEGTFVGGGFGPDEGPVTAEQDEGEHAAPSLLAGAAVPAGHQGQGAQTSAPGAAPDEEDPFPSDVEGTSTEPTPGERNDPV